MNSIFSLKNRSERQVSISARVAKLVTEVNRHSLSKGNAKQKRKFDMLSKQEKRAWREELQRKVNALKTRLTYSVHCNSKLRGKTRHRWNKLNKEEEALWEQLQDDENDGPITSVDFQAGVLGKAAIATGSTVAAFAVVKTAQAVASAAGNASELMQHSQAFVGKMDNLLSSFTASVSAFVDKLKEYGKMIWQPCLIALAIWILTRYVNAPILASVVISAVVVYLPELKGLLEKYLPGAFKTQDGLTATADMITMMMTCWVPGNSVKNMSGEFMKRVSNFPRAADGLETFIKKVLGLVEQLLNFVMKKQGDERITLTGKLDAYQKWRMEVIEQLTYLAKNPMVPIEKIREIKKLQITGFGFHQVMLTHESKRDLNYWHEKLSLALAPHEGAVNADNNMRAMPACLMIGGDSGTGKTTLLRYIASCILMLSKECSVKNALENMWQKGTTEYWNGYIGQKCLVFDDCFQVKPKAGDMDSEAMQFIRGIGNWSMPLNFADLGNKGKIYLDSCLVMGTTNCKNVHAEWSGFITEPTALVRRFQTAVWVKVNPDFATEEGRFDFHKVNNLLASSIEEIVNEANTRAANGDAKMTVSQILDKMPWHVWECYNHTFDRENISEAQYPGGLRAMIESIADTIIQRKTANQKEIKDITRLLEVLDDSMDVEVQAGLTNFEVEQTCRDARMVGAQAHPLPEEPSAESSGQTIGPTFESEEEEQQFQDENGSDYLSLVKQAEWETRSGWDKLYARIKSWYEFILEKLHLKEVVSTVATGLMTGVVLKLVIDAAFAVIFGLIGALCKVFKFITSMFGFKSESNEQKEDKVKTTEMRIASFNSVETQAGSPSEDVYDNIYANTLKCRVEGVDVGQFIGLGADVFLFPKHYLLMLRGMNEKLMMTFVSAKDDREMKMSIGDFLRLKSMEIDGYDIAGVAFGRCFAKSNKTIVKFFLTQHELKNQLRGGNTPVRLDVATFRKDNTLKQKTLYSPTCYYHGKAQDDATKAELDGLAWYVANTVSGDCGAPLMLAEMRHYDARVILGFHSAGRKAMFGNQGFSTLVSQEVAREIFNNLRTYEDTIDLEAPHNMKLSSGQQRVELQSELRENGLVQGSFELIGELYRPVNAPSKTKLQPSDMHRDKLFGPCPVAPAILRATEKDGRMIEPMVQGLKAYQTPLVYKDPHSLRPIVDLAMQKHWAVTEHYPRCVLTFEEAIKAPVGWKLKPINRKTSAGYWWASYVTPRTPGKTAFFGHEGEYEFDYENRPALEQLRDTVDAIVSDAKAGTRRLHLCSDFLKDELRPLHKVESVSTRVISGTSVDYTIAVRQYFGAFMAAMFATHIDNGMAPGVNQYTGWYKLASNLKRVGEDTFDGDFSRFDASEQPWVHEAILAYINRWYKFNNPKWSQDDERVREVLWLDLVHSRHITGTGQSLKYVVQWNKSLPSGHPLTTAVNSMYSLITLTGCYMRATGDTTDMWKHVFINTFGDDNITSVDDEVKDKFNQVTVAGLMDEMFDLTYTPGNKSGVLVPYTRLENCTFLKRAFRVDDAIANRLLGTGHNLGWVGPLAEESFLYVGYWYKNARNPMMDMITRLEFALCELCLHTEDRWNEIFPKIQDWCHLSGIPLKLTSRDSTRAFVSERVDVWF